MHWETPSHFSTVMEQNVERKCHLATSSPLGLCKKSSIQKIRLVFMTL